jgi:hypothetical protein
VSGLYLRLANDVAFCFGKIIVDSGRQGAAGEIILFVLEK